MFLHLLFTYLFYFLVEFAAKPVTPKAHISYGGISSSNQLLLDRSPQQDEFFPDLSNTGDISAFGDEPTMFLSTPGLSGTDSALFDGEVSPLDPSGAGVDEYNGDAEELTAQDPANLDMFADSSGEGAEMSASCQEGDNIDSFVGDPSALISRNLIDDYFDLRIPGEMLAPHQLCPNPLGTKSPSTQSTEDNSNLPFRVPAPDLAGERCGIDIGEEPTYALCCFLPPDGNEEHACYPGKVFFFSFPSRFRAIKPLFFFFWPFAFLCYTASGFLFAYFN